MTATTSRPTGRIPADTFAHRLILVRAMAGHLSIREAADRCRVGRGAWQNWERGSRPDDYAALVRLISEQFGIDEQWLREGGPLPRTEQDPPPARWARARLGEMKTYHTAAERRPPEHRPPARSHGPAGARPAGRSPTSIRTARIA